MQSLLSLFHAQLLRKILSYGAFLFVLILLNTSLLQAQCMQYEVSVEQRTAESILIVEGKVARQVSYWDKAHTMIYTSYYIEVQSVLKSQLTKDTVKVGDTVEVMAEGGKVDDFGVHIEPGVQLENGMAGMFFLKKAPFIEKDSIERSPKPVFELVASNQGVIYYKADLGGGDVFKTYANIRDIYSEIEKQTNKKISGMPEALKEYLLKDSPKNENGDKILATITSISPTTITAGTASVLTINGSGFGATRGTRSVGFSFADNGGQYNMLSPYYIYISWSDTKIEVWVPSLAGTGSVKVYDAAHNAIATSGTLTVKYSTLEERIPGVTSFPYKLSNINSQGGYTYTYNTNFYNNIAAREAFNRGMQEWRCSTFVNFRQSTSTTSIGTSSITDGINLISFSNTLGTGELGTTKIGFQTCNSTTRVLEFDILFRENNTGGVSWNYGPGPTTGGKYDFQSVATHEIGHAHALAHVIAPGSLMHYAISTNTDIRTLDPARAVAGGLAVLSRSTNSSCGITAMTPLPPGSCSLDCDKLNISGAVRQGTTSKYWRTIKVTNLKIPSSPIDKIIISFASIPNNTAPPWLGQNLTVNPGVFTPSTQQVWNATNSKLTPASAPFTVIDLKCNVPGETVVLNNNPEATGYVQFELGLDLAVIPNGWWNGNVTITTIHCDGGACTNTFRWCQALPYSMICQYRSMRNPMTNDPIQSRLFSSRFLVKGDDTVKIASLSIVPDQKDGALIFAIAGRESGINEEKGKRSMAPITGTKIYSEENTPRYAALIEFGDGLLPGVIAEVPVVVEVPENSTAKSVLLHLTYFDEEGNIIYMDSTVASKIVKVDDDHFGAVAGNNVDLHPAEPIPATGTVRFSYWLSSSQEITLELYDALGRKIANIESGTREAGEHVIMHETKMIPSGAYRILLTTPYGVYSQPVIVQH